METLTRDEVEELQRSLLRGMVAHAYANVPFYARAFASRGVTLADIKTADDLARLPLIAKADLRKEPEAFLAANLPRQDWVTFRTSGSTGQPLDFYYDREAMRLLVEMQRTGFIGKFWRLYRPGTILGKGYTRVDVSHPHGVFAMYRQTLPTPPRYPLLSVYDPVDIIFDKLVEIQPDLIFSYGSFYEVMLMNLPASALRRIRPKVLVFFSDAMRPTVRAAVNELWGCEIFGVYGSAEGQMLGYECVHHSGYHLFDGLCAFRIVDDDGQEVKAGERGQLILSNLFNKAMVLLNYRQADIVVKGDPCPCGCPLPKISALEGQVDDMLILPDGRALSPGIIGWPLVQGLGVDQFQIVQHDRKRITLRAATRRKPTDALTQALVANPRALLSPDVNVTVEYVDQILPDPRTGKLKEVISIVPKNEHG